MAGMAVSCRLNKPEWTAPWKRQDVHRESTVERAATATHTNKAKLPHPAVALRTLLHAMTRLMADHRRRSRTATIPDFPYIRPWIAPPRLAGHQRIQIGGVAVYLASDGHCTRHLRGAAEPHRPDDHLTIHGALITQRARVKLVIRNSLRLIL